MLTQSQLDTRYDEISAQMADPALSPEAYLTLANEQLQLLEEMRRESNTELIAEQEALLQDLRALQVRRSFRYRFHCECYRFRGLIWLAFFAVLCAFPLFLFLVKTDPWIGLPGVTPAPLSLAWAVWSSHPPKAGDAP